MRHISETIKPLPKVIFLMHLIYFIYHFTSILQLFLVNRRSYKSKLLFGLSQKDKNHQNISYYLDQPFGVNSYLLSMVVLNLLSIPLKSGNLKGNKGYLEKGTWISHFVYLTVASSFFHVIVASFLGIFVPRLVLLLTRVFMT